MTAAAAVTTTHGSAEEAQSWELEARSLARLQQALARPDRWTVPFFAPSRLTTALERAREKLASSPADDATLGKPAEWFLDNYYLVRRVARQVAQELPRGFVRRLPLLAEGPEKGVPRVYVLASVLMAKTGIAFDAGLLRRFVRTYQEVSPLTIAELWALPMVLRASVLTGLVQFLGELGVVAKEVLHPAFGRFAVDPTTGAERAIRALRVLAEMDWKVFFEETSRVEAVLRTDPTQIYGRMDFATCDLYRKAVEDLAWNTLVTEEEVAASAVALAAQAAPDERCGHVGYYLVDAGRHRLEQQLGYRARGLERARRWIQDRPTFSYLAAVSLLTLALVALAGWYAAMRGAGLLSIAAVLGLTLGPAAFTAVAVVQWALARFLPPRLLPKLDFTKGLSADARTLVVIPTLLGRREDVTGMTRRLELHYLSNPHPTLSFAVLTDDLDAKSAPQDHELLHHAAAAIAALNAKHGKNGTGPFHLLHRKSRWNAAEDCFMGWERKRGKLEELNRLLREKESESYACHEGDPQGLERIRFVITVDSDTELPMGSAQRLIGILAHPLNRAVFDPDTGRVIAGYTIVQPRIETSPASAGSTRFFQAFAGDVGFDIYTHASSDLYQDLFGSGIYVGKGIYDVEAFTRSLEGRAPENALLSHDLFEGIHGRAALASDVVLFEDYPSHYASYARRMHRWVCGDFQLVPWLFRKVPSSHGERVSNRLSFIDRWKIADNLRRGLTAPLLLLLLVSGWTWLPGEPLLWTFAALSVFFVPLLLAMPHGHRGLPILARVALGMAFLLHEAAVVVDAAARTFARMTITRKHLLQWTSAAQTQRKIHHQSRGFLWREMLPSPLLAGLIAALVSVVRPDALAVSLPLLALWLVAPELARWVSLPAPKHDEPLAAEDVRRLRRLARRTWLFFETVVGPGDQWLPVDNYQETPHEQTAHRTSPTNIGMLLLSALSAYDLGYLGAGELLLRLRSTLESVDRLEHYRGHLLNWYETKNLQPLLPRYVSTVDSGNFAGCLLALQQGCKDAARARVVRAETWDGLTDSLDLIEEVLGSTKAGSAESLRSLVAGVRRVLRRMIEAPREAYVMLRTLCDESAPELDRELLMLLDAGAYRHEVETLHVLRTWVDRLHHQLHGARREIDTLLPWLALTDEPAAAALVLPEEAALDEVPSICRRLCGELDAWEEAHRSGASLSLELEASAGRLRQAFRSAEASAESLCKGLLEVAFRAGVEAYGMDFQLLFDADRKLFRIGYNVTQDVADGHHYDLLASEARLASYLAIVKHDVPEAHWYSLGRPMTRVADGLALLSWGGTMFEYLMPSLLMRAGEGSLLAQTCERAVQAQIARGKEQATPWGVSESAYARQDAHHTYQYRSFGVPGLGFRRYLADDKVVAPYASILAVSVRPRAVIDNLGELEALGMLGTYGLFEALDVDPERAPSGRAFVVVRSYMAHHQGMLLVALNNYLHADVMVERFHADPSVEMGEMLLNERMPNTVPPEWPTSDSAEPEGVATASTLRSAPSWSPRGSDRTDAFVLSNGRLTTWLTDSGGGGLRWHGLALTSYRPDPTCDTEGCWIYLSDEESGRVWRATSADGRTTYSAHQVEFHLRDQGISAHVDVTVATADDVEVRQITLHNETDRPRRILVTSAAEPTLLPAEATGHPAFSRLFVESEFVTELDALVFTRRQRSTQEGHATLVYRLVREGPRVTLAGYETDRSVFFGRSGTLHMPKSLLAGQAGPRGTVGAVLDPVMSLRARVELRPQGSVTFAFVAAVDRSRSATLELARRYGSMHAVRWAFRDAEQESLRRLERARLNPDLLPTVQRLLSALVFAEPSLRASRDVIARGRPEKRRLWGRGISGDSPILLVRVHDAQAQLLSETIAAHRYLRACGVRIDLVLVDEQATGYITDGVGTLRSALVRHEVDDWLNQRGGIYVVPRDQLSAEDERHLGASARAVLDTRDGSLAARLARPVASVPNLPRFEPTRAEQPAQPSARPRPTLLFDNGFGGFSEDGREYVISVVRDKPTPAPWCNVLANPSFGCLASESSLGYTWSENSGENRLTPWRNDPLFDTPSEAIYLRDEETAAIWSPTPLPAGLDAETTVRHGAGYTKYASESHGLEQDLTVFVPADAPVKIARLKLKNTLPSRRRVTATYYAEWVLGSAPEEQRAYVVSELERPHACLLATCSWNAVFGGRVAFLASELRVHGFTADRMEFLGRRGDYARPAALERWGFAGRTEDAGVDPCAALQVHLELAPGEEVETHFVLGQASDRDEALRLAAHFRSPTSVDAAWAALTARWDALLGNIRVKTPEPSMDLMINRWLLYQTVSSRLFGRTGFYQSSGAFGFRDQLQDVLALLHADPARTRAHILEAAAHQFEQGDVLHWWHPPSQSGVRTRCSDDLMWLPYVTAEYVAATGDMAILSERVSFLTAEPLRRDEHDRYAEYGTSSDAPLLEHCRRALERGLTQGRHGLPLMGDGDWNDGMNQVGSKGEGESVWLGWFFCATAQRFASLCDRLGEHEEAAKWRARVEILRASLDACAWDGAWYLRAFHDDGSPLGSATSRECRIDSIAQSWAVLSGAANAERARLAVRAADEQLVREEDRLVLLLWPPFATTVHDPGYIRAYPRGVRENGGQYTHAATWLGWAFAALGEGDRAERIFRLLNPVLRARTAEEVARYRVEPFVLAGDIYSCPPWTARGGWTWYTGAAGWAYRLGVEAILGLQKAQGQLRIDPCIPARWKGFEAWLQWGEQEVHVVVDNPDAVCAGIAEARLDGAVFQTHLVPLDPRGVGKRELYVRLGVS